MRGGEALSLFYSLSPAKKILHSFTMIQTGEGTGVRYTLITRCKQEQMRSLNCNGVVHFALSLLLVKKQGSDIGLDDGCSQK